MLPYPPSPFHQQVHPSMQRKHVIFFTIVALVCVVALIIFQMLGDPNPMGGGPEDALPAAPAE